MFRVAGGAIGIWVMCVGVAQASPRVETIAGSWSLQSVGSLALTADDELITSNGQIRAYTAAGDQDDTLQVATGQLQSIGAVATGPSGDIYVADSSQRKISRFDADGHLISTFGSQGTGPGRFSRISDLEVSPSGDVFVADGGNATVQEFTPSGSFVRSIGTPGPHRGELEGPTSVAVGSGGDVYIVDAPDHSVEHFAGDGTFIGDFGNEGTADGRLLAPAYLTVSQSGDVLVSDNQTLQVSRFGPGGVYKDSFSTVQPGPNYGSAGKIAVDSQDRIYLADSARERVEIYSPEGQLLGTRGSAGEQLGKIYQPRAIASAPDGGFYISESPNDRLQRFSASGQPLLAIGSTGSEEGELRNPGGLAVDGDGAVYVADTDNGRVEKFVDDAFDSVIGDDELVTPTDVAVADDGSLYVSDQTNGGRILHYANDGELLGVVVDSGAGTVDAIDVGSNDQIFVVDLDRRVRRYSSSGQLLNYITYSADPGTNIFPTDIAVAPNDDVYMLDLGFSSKQIEVVRPDGTYVESVPAVGFDRGRAIAATSSPDQVLVLSRGSVQRVGKAPIRVKFDSAPPPRSRNLMPSFTFSSSAPGTTFECRIDAAAFHSCSGPGNSDTEEVREGSHTFYVRGTDPQGDISDIHQVRFDVVRTGPRYYAFKTDQPALRPGNYTTDSSPTFSLPNDVPGVSYECSLEGGPFLPCQRNSLNGYEMSNLPDGPHSFAARETDDLGNVGAPDEISFTVDTTPPTASVDSDAPSDGEEIGDTRLEFGLSSSEAGSTFKCDLYLLQPLEQRYSGDCYGYFLATLGSDGEYRFTLRATDKAGNVSDPLIRNFSLDDTPPTIRFTGGPADGALIGNSRPVFSFDDGADPDPASFMCSYDGLEPQSCESGDPWPVVAADGRHSLSVTATDDVSNVSAKISRSFEVDTRPPALVLRTPSLVTVHTVPARVQVQFTSSERATFTCRVDSGSRRPCSSPFSVDLGRGRHQIEVIATDDVGNSKARSATVTVRRIKDKRHGR